GSDRAGRVADEPKAPRPWSTAELRLVAAGGLLVHHAGDLVRGVRTLSGRADGQFRELPNAARVCRARAVAQRGSGGDRPALLVAPIAADLACADAGRSTHRRRAGQAATADWGDARLGRWLALALAGGFQLRAGNQLGLEDQDSERSAPVGGHHVGNRR